MPRLSKAQRDRQLRRDARNRALRSFLQGLAIDLAVAIALVLSAAFGDANGWSDFEWQLLGFTAAKTVVQTGTAYLMRRFLDSSRVRTPLPPAEAGEPDDDQPA